MRAPLRGAAFAALAIGTIAKLWLALTTFGTNDVRYWDTFRDYLSRHDSAGIYRDIWYYNHPPLMTLVLRLFHRLAPHLPNGFPFLMRLPAIVADVGSGLLLLRLMQRAFPGQEAERALIVFGLSPVLLLISGFHGNTDPVFVCLILLAADRVINADSPLQAGLALGVAANIKLVPLLCCPLFFFWLPGWRARARLTSVVAVALLAGYGYHAAVDWPDLKRNVFAYQSLHGTWGLTQIFESQGATALDGWYLAWGTPMLFALLLAVAVLAGVRANAAGPEARAALLLRSIGLTFLVFLIACNGFGIQYLAWLAAPSLFLGLGGAIGFNLLAGLFAFRVYHFWNGGFPWTIADSDLRGGWMGTEKVLALSVWLFLVLWAQQLLRAAMARRVEPAR